eukprot:CAMPEP_0182908396 /NCGR_PEP_ID=MMETSP0034_2-20130328/35190_1 /TAXON_ID=156128 /ORGANISM="Nephroselmis pyriformis, Strain CCMP717" /LENGTH=53 /DNA_ID=CAMNT_0025044573 /DNA_START=77 /DNA_END=235 /DNA_ORIENTATION=-
MRETVKMKKKTFTAPRERYACGLSWSGHDAMRFQGRDAMRGEEGAIRPVQVVP